MPAPELPALLSHLRWLDRMETWNEKKFSVTLSQVARRKRDRELYSWSGNFGNPIVLPQIKKYSDAEKYRSTQITKRAFAESGNNKTKLKVNAKTVKAVEKVEKDKQAAEQQSQHSLVDFYKPEIWLSKEKTSNKKKFHSVPTTITKEKNRLKQTSFRIHAKAGFKYWPEDLYKRTYLPGRFSFGKRFNPGRAGVLNDRIYAKPNTNYD